MAGSLPGKRLAFELESRWERFRPWRQGWRRNQDHELMADIRNKQKEKQGEKRPCFS
jgi:hypothetical protein